MKISKANYRFKYGQTLLEILIAITIFSVLSVMLILSLSQLLRRQSLTTTTNLASILLQQTMEDLYAMSQTTQWTALDANTSPVYIKSTDFNNWNISTSEFNSMDLQAAIYVRPTYRRISTGEIDSDCTSVDVTSGICEEDTAFKKLDVTVYPTGADPVAESLASATYYMTDATLLTSIGTGAVPTPLPSTPPTPTIVEPTPTTAPPITNTNNDVQWTGSGGGGTLNKTSTKLRLGGNANNWVGLRFPVSGIPAYSTIISAYVLGNASDTVAFNANFGFDVFGDTDPNNADFATTNPNCTARSCTTVKSRYQGKADPKDADGNVWLANNWYQLGDLTEIVQKIVDQDLWTSSSPLAFLFQGTSTDNSIRNIFSSDSGSSAPQLYLVFLTPTPIPTNTPTPTTGPTPTPTPTGPPTPTPTPNVVWAINSGGGAYIGYDGVPYSADQNYSGGNAYSIPSTTSIDFTPDDTLYQSERWNGTTFNYSLPVPSGYYKVILKFAEIYFNSANSRQFSATIENQTVFTNLDIYYVNDRKNTAYDVVYRGWILDGWLNISLIPGAFNNPKISAIRVESSSTFPVATSETQLWYATDWPEGGRLDVFVDNDGAQIGQNPAWGEIQVYNATTNAYIGLLSDYHVKYLTKNELHYYEPLTTNPWSRGDYWRYHGNAGDFRVRGLPRYIQVKLPPYDISKPLDLGPYPVTTPTPTPTTGPPPTATPTTGPSCSDTNPCTTGNEVCVGGYCVAPTSTPVPTSPPVPTSTPVPTAIPTTDPGSCSCTVGSSNGTPITNNCNSPTFKPTCSDPPNSTNCYCAL